MRRRKHSRHCCASANDLATAPAGHACLSLMRAFQTARARTDTGHLAVAAFLQVVYCTLREVVQGRTWHHAFAACGYTMGQTHVNESVLSELGLAHRPEVSSACPDEQQLQYSLPRNCTTLPLELLDQALGFLPVPPLPPPLEPPPARPRFRIMPKSASHDEFGCSAHVASSQCSVPAVPWPLTLRVRANGWWRSMHGGHKGAYAGRT